MYRKLLYCFAFCFSFGLCADELIQRSVTGGMSSYLEVCKKAVADPYYFQNFRSLPEYWPILECGCEAESASYLLKNGSQQTLQKLDAIRKLEKYGNPVTHNLSGVGRFSGTTLRYIVIGDHIGNLFDLPKNPTIAEIGAGFGGQCYVLSQLTPFSKYYIYDLPEVEGLIGKMMKTMSVSNVELMGLNDLLPEEKVDLVISNYAFSECDLSTQLSYFERVMQKGVRGYVIFNLAGGFEHLSSCEFYQMLDEHGMNPQVLDEPVFTYDGNLLLIWDKTKE